MNIYEKHFLVCGKDGEKTSVVKLYFIFVNRLKASQNKFKLKRVLEFLVKLSINKIQNNIIRATTITLKITLTKKSQTF